MSWALILKYWREGLLLAFAVALVTFYYRGQYLSERVASVSQENTDLKSRVAQIEKDAEDARKIEIARAQERATMNSQLSEMQKNLLEVMKNDEIANAWRGGLLPGSILDSLRGRPSGRLGAPGASGSDGANSGTGAEGRK